MKKVKTKLLRLRLGLVILCLLAANLVFLVPKATAAALTHTSVIELGGASNVNPMIASDGQSFAIAFTTPTGGATSVSIDFGSAWTSAGGLVTSGSTSVSNTGCQALTGATNGLPGTLTASGSGTAITVSGVTALTAGQSYCTELTSATAVTNPTATGDYSVAITAGADSQTVAIDVLGTGANAYSITGTIGSTFTMSLSSTTDTFATNLSASAVTTSTGITTTINTNAASGWFVWAKDSNAGLTSTSASHTIPSVATGSPFTFNGGAIGADHYGLGVSANNTANYAYGGGTTGSGLSTTVFNEIATSGSPANNVTFVNHELADISPTSPPASDYTDVITLIGAGSF